MGILFLTKEARIYNGAKTASSVSIPKLLGKLTAMCKRMKLEHLLRVCVLSHFNHVQLFSTPWTIALQAPLCVGFPRQEYWSGLLFPPPKDILTQGLNHSLLHWQKDSLLLYHLGSPSKWPDVSCCCCCSVTKSCLTLCDPMDCSTPGSSVHGISQARILE